MKDNLLRFASSPAGASSLASPRRDATRPKPAWSYPPARLLAPIDFGEASAHALAVADALARRHRAALSVLHADIIEAPVYFTREQAAAIESERQSAARAMQREMERFVRGIILGRAHTRFVEDAPATAIVEAAAHADLVVMGTHGRRGPSRWWLGSVAERIVRESPVPVLVVRAIPAGSAAAPEAPFKRPVLVANRTPTANPRSGVGRHEGEAVRYAHGVAAAFGGTVPEGVLACADDLVRERHASLLVIPRRSRGTPWLDTHAERLLRVCTLPMLFVPDEG